MDRVVEALNARAAEIDLFIQFLRRIQKPSSLKSIGFAANVSELVPILKACLFVLLYNMIENVVRAGFAAVYEDIEKKNISFDSTTEELQKIWLKQQLDRRAPLTSANRDTYLNAMSEIVRRISEGKVLDLGARELPISGNLNAQQIKELCRKHGVELKVPAWARGGADLDTIKVQRNGLAHGDISFVECGRDFAVDDLERMYKRTRLFLRGAVRSLKRYADGQKYSARKRKRRSHP